jgi:hypothetical protein
MPVSRVPADHARQHWVAVVKRRVACREPDRSPQQPIENWPAEHAVGPNGWVAERQCQGEGKIAADNLNRRDPERCGEVDERALLHSGNDIAAKGGVASSADVTLVEVGIILEVDARRRQKACKRTLQSWDVEADAAFRRARWRCHHAIQRG